MPNNREPPDIREQLRQAIARHTRSLYGRWGLCRCTGVPSSTVARFLAGKRGITLDTAARLAEPLKLTLKRRHARPAKDKEATQC